MILYLLTYQAARTRSSVSASLLVPRFGSLSNSGRTSAHRGPNVETDQPLVHVVDCQNAFPDETLREGLPGEYPKRSPARRHLPQKKTDAWATDSESEACSASTPRLSGRTAHLGLC